MVDPHRSSGSSFASSAFSRPSSSTSGRLTPHRAGLSIAVPDAAPFVPSLAGRPSSSLSRATWTTDGTGSNSVDSEAEAEELGSEGWEDQEQSSDRERAGLLHGMRVTERRYYHHSSVADPEGEATADTPTTPITLPPASSSNPPSPNSADEHQLSNHVESMDNSMGMVGLGVDPEFIERQAQRLQMRSIEGMRERAAHQHEGGRTTEDDLHEDVEELWKEDSSEEAVEVDAGVGGSGSLGAGGATSVPFPSYNTSPIPHPVDITNSPLDRELPPLPPSGPSSPRSPHPTTRSPHPSITSTATSSNSSTLSLPHVPPVDLTLPNRSNGPWMSVASGPMARLAADGTSAGLTRSNSQRGPRAFFSNLLSRSPRSPNLGRSSPVSSPSTSPSLGGPSRSPSAPTGFQNPAVSAAIRQGTHNRSSSLPSPNPSIGSFAESAEAATPPSRSPLMRHSPALSSQPRSRAGSLQVHSASTSPMIGAPDSPATASSRVLPSSRPTSSAGTALPRSASAPLPSTSAATPPPPTLNQMGLNLLALTQPMSLSRNSQPLCGALLDDKYILIGTTGGLDFLPIPLPGSLPMKSHGKKRRETRKPISLIKRTRFKELAVLSERSNILLAIAGRNDHIRVYALDGIRAMIEKKMSELDVRDGYPVIPDGGFLRPQEAKGKARAEPPPPATAVSPTPPFQYSAPSPPPDYSVSAPSPTSVPRRRGPPAGLSVASPTTNSFGLASLEPSSPHRSTHRAAAAAGNIVRAVPTNPRPTTVPRTGAAAVPSSPRTLRGAKSREFVAARKTSSAVIVKRKTSKLELNSGSASVTSRRSSTTGEDAAEQSETAAAGPVERDDVEDGGDEAEHPSRFLQPEPSMVRRSSTTSSIGDSGWATDPSNSPVVNRGAFPRPQSRDAYTTVPRTETGRSPSQDLAAFLRTTEPGVPSPVIEEADSPRPGISRAKSYNDASPERNSPLAEGMRRAQSVKKLEGRSATVVSRDANGRSPVQDLAEFFREGPSTQGSVARKVPREETSPRMRQKGQHSPILELASVIRETGPDDNRASVSTFAGYSMKSSSSSALSGSPRLGSTSSPLLSNASSSASATASRSPLLPRDATSACLKPNERSPSQELAEVLRETGPPIISSHTGFPTSASFPAKGKAVSRPTTADAALRRGSSDESLRRSSYDGGRRASLDVRPPMPRRRSSLARLIARSPITRPGGEDSTEDDDELLDGQAARRPGLTLAEAIRDGPPLGFQDSTGLVPSPSSTSINGSVTGSPTSRQAKRWTMSGMSSKFLNRPSSSDGPSPNPGSSSRRLSGEQQRRSSQQFDDAPSRRGSAQFLDASNSNSTPSARSPPPPVVSPTPSASTPLPPHDFKRSPSALQPPEPPTLPASSQVPPDAHPANSSSPLEYVKLARTKGARLLRAVETKKRTYLAVLCGDEGERIELFTGSRSISLSLNRTFVLPENPKTIEFQIQGDDLIDIYLVYPESIFALEPATVRVREVGVGRGERRARRERERRMRDIASSATAEPGALSESASSTLYPADPALSEQANLSPNPENSAGETENLTGGIDMGSRTPSPRPETRSNSRSRMPAESTTLTPNRNSDPPLPPPRDEAPPVPPRSKSNLPYSTFQQLPFVPPVPSSVLSSAWIIPPLYTDVVDNEAPESGAHPSITVTGDAGGSSQPTQAPPDLHHYPLLSPISLLGGAAQRANGPPGLFFVSKGKNLSGIVTGDGRSVIKRPMVWNLEKGTETDQPSDMYRRIEMIIVGGTKTVVVGIGSSEVKAIAVGGAPGLPPFGTALNVSNLGGASKSTDIREVELLGNHSVTNQLFYSSRVGQSFAIYCLAAQS